MDISELVAMTREITVLFNSEVGPWNASVLLTELTGELGTLADSIMIKEGHRKPRNDEPLDLDDDVVDVMFMLVRIADYYGIDIEHAYMTMLEQTREKLENRLNAKKREEREKNP